MANIVRNNLTVTGPNDVLKEVLKATTRRYIEKGWRIDPNGPIVAYFSDDCVTLPADRRKQRTMVFPDEQKLFVRDNEIEIDFESTWSGPVWEVQEVSRQFPALTFRLWGWDRSASYGWFYSIIAGVVTELDMREAWGPREKELAAKYQIRVTSDTKYDNNDDGTRGTILFEGVERCWTWEYLDDSTATVVIWGIPEHSTGLVITKGDILHQSTWRVGASRPDEIYEAVVNELQAGPPPPRDSDDDDSDDDPQPDEYVVVKAYSTAAGR